MSYYTNPVARKHAAVLNPNTLKCYMDIAGINVNVNADDGYSSPSAASDSVITCTGIVHTDSFETMSPATSTTASTKFNHSSDSLSSFEDYRTQWSNEPPATFVYFKCAIPTSQASCTSDFISAMCCNCGRGGSGGSGGK